MKLKILALLFFFITYSSFCQKKFVLMPPNTEALTSYAEKNKVDTAIILLYLENNYATNSKKHNILKDPDFNNQECGFSKKFKFNIIFTTNNCGEAAPIIEKITFPKTTTKALKNWIDKIYKIGLPKDVAPYHEWYENGLEFGPKDKEAGCYYKIQQTTTNSIVEIWCGC
mgnify:CR=1 FL=1